MNRRELSFARLCNRGNMTGPMFHPVSLDEPLPRDTGEVSHVRGFHVITLVTCLIYQAFIQLVTICHCLYRSYASVCVCVCVCVCGTDWNLAVYNDLLCKAHFDRIGLEHGFFGCTDER